MTEEPRDPDLPETLTQEEKNAIRFCVERNMIRFDGKGIFDPDGKQLLEDVDPTVTRFCLCLFLARVLYPEFHL